MNCKECVKINPLPSCLGDDATFEINNLTFPDYTGEELTVVITDTATQRVSCVAGIADDVIDITDIYPLMQHYYEIKFLVDGVQASFIIANPDGTFSEGCCLEFIPSEGLQWNGAEYAISTTQCVVA